MSGLAALLAGRRPAAVYRWHSAVAAADVAHTVEHAGWRYGYVDGWVAPGRTGFLDGLAASLELPEWFGHNYDALADSLADLAEPTVVLWDGWEVFARAAAADFATALAVLTQRTEQDPSFVVLLRSSHPDPDSDPHLDPEIPWLDL